MMGSLMRRFFSTSRVRDRRGWDRIRWVNMTKPEVIDGVPNIEGVSTNQYPIKIKWYDPVRVPKVRPNAKGSGDLSPLPSIDLLAHHPVTLTGSTRLSDAPEVVKKANSLAYQRHALAVEFIQEKALEKTRHHRMDSDSLAVQITKLTMRIRNHQKYFVESGWENNQARKHSLQININIRNRMLGKLREMDYKEYEYLLRELDLVYKPDAENPEKIFRFIHTERLTDLWCDEIKTYKMEQLKLKYQKEQPSFLREKAQTLQWMMKEEQELGLESTVKQSDIDECLKKADEIETKIKDVDEVDMSQFKIYEPVVVKEDTFSTVSNSS